MSMEKHPLQMKTPELQKSEEVQEAVEKKERLATVRNETLRESGAEGPLEKEKIPNDPSERIEVYMDRLENVFLNPDEAIRKRNLEMLRPKIYEALLIKPENFPESFFELQKRVAREQGHGDIEITPEIRERMIETSIEDQKHSLDAWIDYLTSEDAVYPTWFKYYAWTQITKLSQFDKERGEFKKRTDKTVAPFPDIYREPLAELCDLYLKVKENNKNLNDEEIKRIFSQKFPSAYAEFIQKSLAAQIEKKEGIEGEWIKYEQGDMDQAERLFNSLESKGTGWCTAGKSTAETQIKSGDFYVYYTNDEQGQPTQPRLAIRMNGKSKIGEVRGILPHQEVEPVMQEILDEKLKEFGQESKAYHKKSQDMKRLTEIDNKAQNNEELSVTDLIFLYEVDGRIEGFGYSKDPRINEILKNRDSESDYTAIAHYIFNNPEKFSDDAKKKAEDTIRAQEIENKAELTRDDLIFLYELKSRITTFDSDLLQRIYKIKNDRDKYKDARILSEKTNQLADKVEQSIPLTKEDLEYLFELNGQKIETYFDIHDNRIGRMRQKVNVKDNLHILFECSPDEIAYTPKQINKNTKAWAGKISPEIVEKLPDTVTHIHQEFPRHEYQQRDPSYLGPFYDWNYADRLPCERKFTALEKKVISDEPLNKDDLTYLYHLSYSAHLIDHKDELYRFRAQRNPKEDILTIFDCSKDEVAYNAQEITEKTKIYIGEIGQDLFKKLPESIERIYTDFSARVDRRLEIKRKNIEIGGKTKDELLRELEMANFKITDDARKLINEAPSKPNNDVESRTFIELPCGALGIYSGEFYSKTYSDLESKAFGTGLYRCSLEDALAYILYKKPENKLMAAVGNNMLNAQREYRKTNYVLGTTHNGLEADWYTYLFVVGK